MMLVLSPSKRLLYYFDIFVKNAGAKGQIAIGFTISFRLRRQPAGKQTVTDIMVTMECCIMELEREIDLGLPTPLGIWLVVVSAVLHKNFFHENGEFVGAVHKDIKGQVFPTVAVHCQSEKVTVNFGKDPSIFDLKLPHLLMRHMEQNKEQNNI